MFWPEEAFISKLVLVTAGEEHRICWAMGHGEPDPDDEFSERGVGAAVLLLESLNYRVTREVIPTAGVDPGCDALVVAAPTTDWLPWELEGLAAYIGGGGRALFLMEPLGPPRCNKNPRLPPAYFERHADYGERRWANP